jgi:hypothetical protein
LRAVACFRVRVLSGPDAAKRRLARISLDESMDQAESFPVSAPAHNRRTGPFLDRARVGLHRAFGRLFRAPAARVRAWRGPAVQGRTGPPAHADDEAAWVLGLERAAKGDDERPEADTPGG